MKDRAHLVIVKNNHERLKSSNETYKAFVKEKLNFYDLR